MKQEAVGKACYNCRTSVSTSLQSCSGLTLSTEIPHCPLLPAHQSLSVFRQIRLDYEASLLNATTVAERAAVLEAVHVRSAEKARRPLRTLSRTAAATAEPPPPFP